MCLDATYVCNYVHMHATVLSTKRNALKDHGLDQCNMQKDHGAKMVTVLANGF